MSNAAVESKICKYFAKIPAKFIAKVGKYVRTFFIPVDGDFWEDWRAYKDELKVAGVQVSPYKGLWQASLWTQEENPTWLAACAQAPATPVAPAIPVAPATPVFPSPVSSPATVIRQSLQSRYNASVTLPNGIYMVNGKVFQVKHNKYGIVYAKELVVSPGGSKGRFRLRPRAVLSTITPSHRMTIQQAHAFGIQYGICANCGRLLTNTKSVDVGMGPICRKRFVTTAQLKAIVAAQQQPQTQQPQNSMVIASHQQPPADDDGAVDVELEEEEKETIETTEEVEEEEADDDSDESENTDYLSLLKKEAITKKEE